MVKLARLSEAQNWRCAYCAATLELKFGPRQATRDHVVSRGKGGDDGRDNLVAACFACNMAKADMDAHGFWRIRQRALRSGRWPAGETASLNECHRIRKAIQRDEFTCLLEAWRERRGVPRLSKGDKRQMTMRATALGVVFRDG